MAGDRAGWRAADRIAAWDLLALVVLGGVVGLAYRVSKGAATARATLVIAATVGIAIVVYRLAADRRAMTESETAFEPAFAR